MNEKQIKSQGFGVMAVLIIVVVLGVIIGTGYYIKQQNATSDANKISQINASTKSKIQASAKPASNFSSLPTDWQEYKSDALGFRFGYPKVWGQLKAADTTSTASLNLYTDEYDDPALDIQGRVNLTTVQIKDFELTPQKYGATIKPVDDGSSWQVISVNPASADKYSVGDTYNLQTPKKVNGGSLYLVSSADEGCTFSQYIVRLKSVYAQLSIPALCSQDSISPQNQAAYQVVLDGILKSVTIY